MNDTRFVTMDQSTTYAWPNGEQGDVNLSYHFVFLSLIGRAFITITATILNMPIRDVLTQGSTQLGNYSELFTTVCIVVFTTVFTVVFATVFTLVFTTVIYGILYGILYSIHCGMHYDIH